MGYFSDTYGPAVYDIFFESAQGCAGGLIEASSEFFVPGARVLDVGAGTGNVTLEAARRFRDCGIVGVDIDDQALELARHKAAVHLVGNVEFESGDALDLPYGDGTFDLVLANQLVGGAAAQHQMLGEMLRVLRPQGGIGVARSNPDHNEVMQWIYDVALEMAGRRSMNPPAMEDNPWMNTLPVRGMMERAGAQGINTKRFVSAQTDFAAFLINLITQGRNLLELVEYVTQCDPGDEAAQTTGSWEFLQVGRELMDTKYGGKLEIECEVVSGTKSGRAIPNGSVERRARESGIATVR